MKTEYEVLVIEPRLFSGEKKGQTKKINADGNFLSDKLKINEIFNLMDGIYQILKVTKRKE